MDSKTLLQLSHICAGYERKEILHDISLSVADKGFLGITGPNGGGKTTLVKLMLGLIKPTAGTMGYFRNGVCCEKMHTGYLPQQNTSDKRFPITVREVIESGLLGQRNVLHRYSREDKEKADKMVDEMGLNDFANELFGRLSGGQRQRALLGRALISQPEILFLDEPTTYFDDEAREWLNRRLQQLLEGCSVVMVSHEKEDLRSYGGRIVYIESGRLREV